MTNSKLKDSNIEWLGKIPSNWKVKPLYLFFFERKNKNNKGKEKNLLSLSYGKIIQKDINSTGGLLPQSYNTYNVIEAGDIIIRPTDLQNDKHSLRTAFSKEHGIITSAYIDLAPLKDTNSEYFHYVLHAYDIEKVFYNMGNGVRQGLNYSEFSKLKLPIPSSEEQKEIVNFLNNQVSQIDKLSKKIQQEIIDLEEYRKSIITKAVTKGLNPNVPMKDSGIPWIGKIPQNWKIIKGKYLFRLLSKPVKKDDQVITCFRDGQVTLRVKRRTTGFTMSDQEIGYQGIDKGDLVVHGMDGFAGAIGISDSRGKGSPVLNVLDSNQDKKYMMYCLRATAQLGVFQALAKGIRVRSADTRWPTLANLKYAIPPQSEQANVVNYLSNNSYKLNAIIQAKKDLVEKLNQYKQSIIYEYVTGKKQVPTEEGAVE
ncbi:type i site-specific restriction-modification system, s subunit (plasmid) [Lactobacillus amylovorus GRL1118]|uniref:restriction endonuclease subunit S n=1 Tax=Lactobacillus amylovorus TaxID=1604 RepID=UPI0002016850|nr:restriction endonuclease subunit S [Lactobacillus amylovorus]AEA32851.1 type i site-specific restriction-modification system, s subunit [Lactobacillus amylovorus GRL1118]